MYIYIFFCSFSDSFCFCFPAIFHYQCQVGELKVEAIRAPFSVGPPGAAADCDSFFFISLMDMKCLYTNVQECSTHTHTHRYTLDLCLCLVCRYQCQCLISENGNGELGMDGFSDLYLTAAI